MSQPCPACGEYDVHHSRLRSWMERLRFNLTRQVPFRCHRCAWRGWRADSSRPGESLRELHNELTDDELNDLDLDAKPAGPAQRRPSRR